MDNWVARTRLLLAAFLFGSAALFAIGVTIERAGEAPRGEGEATSVKRERAETGHSEEQERRERAAVIDSARAGTLGINPESPAAIIGVVVFSVLLAIRVWLRPAAGPILVAAATFGVVTGVFDGREVVVQIGRADRLLVVLAALVTALHLGVAAVAVAMMRRTIGSAVRLERQT